jgi:hypothetical protein
MEISEYDFDIEYIKGEENIMADATSRLVRAHDDESLYAIRETEEGVRWAPTRKQFQCRVTAIPYTPAKSSVNIIGDAG